MLSTPDLVRDIRRQRHVERLHRLGPRAIDELLLEIGAERHCLTAIEDKLACYAELDSDLALAVGGDRFPEPMLVVVST